MTSESLYRSAGAGLLAGGILAAVGEAAQDFITSDARSGLVIGGSLATVVGSVLVAMCLAAVAVRQADRSGALGLIGYALMAAGILLIGVYANLTNVVIAPNLPASMTNNPPAGVLLSFLVGEVAELVGLVLLGIATIRARVYPSAIGWCLLASAPLFLVGEAPLPYLHYSGGVAAVLSYAALAAFGRSLLRMTPDQGHGSTVGVDLRSQA
jgi:hypothetical protein